MRKKLIAFLLLTLFLTSCAREFTPHQAANRGKMKCGRHTLK
jgi:hypothetical protein